MTNIQSPPLSRNSSSPSIQPPHLRHIPRVRIEPFLYITKSRAISSERAFLVVRLTALIVSLSCLILDIITINFSISHQYTLPFDRLVIPKGSYVAFVLIPDIVVVAMLSILLWKRIRLPLRLWTLHVFCRVVSSLTIAAIGMVYSISEIRFFARRKNNGVEKYFCQGFYPPQWKTENVTGVDDGRAVVDDGGDRADSNGNGIAKFLIQQQEFQYLSLPSGQQSQQIATFQPEYLNHCRVMRSRSMIAFVWVLLVLLELFIAYISNEFKKPEWGRESAWTPQGSGLNKWACDSTSEIWDNGEGANAGLGHQSNEQQIDARHAVLGSRQSSDISLEYPTNTDARDTITNGHDNKIN